MKRGAVDWVSLDKQCPAIILSPDIRNSLANDLIIVPYSTTARRMTWHVQLRRGEAGLPQADLIDRLASSWRIIAAMANPLRWSAIAENVSSPVAVASGEHRVTVFCRGPAGELLVIGGERGEYQPPSSLGVPLARDGSTTVPVDWPIGGCATGPGEIQLVARGPEGELLHGTLRGTEWGGFESIGSPAAWFGPVGVPMGLTSAPVACSLLPGTMDVFALGASGVLLHSPWNGKEFAEFESLGGVASNGGPDSPVLPPISATACGIRSIAIATRGARGDLLVKWWDGTKWTPFASLGLAAEPDQLYPAVKVPVPLSGAPVCAGGGSTRLDVFARGQRGDLLHKWWNGKDWTGFESVGCPATPEGALIPFTSASIASAWGKFQLDVFARASDGKLYAATWSGSGPIATLGQLTPEHDFR